MKISNDANAAALAEFSSGGATRQNLMVVKIGSGVGAGLVINGQQYFGERFAAGEIGHIGPAQFVLKREPGSARHSMGGYAGEPEPIRSGVRPWKRDSSVARCTHPCASESVRTLSGRGLRR